MHEQQGKPDMPTGLLGFLASLSLVHVFLAPDEFIRHIQDEVTWCIMFANDIFLANEIGGLTFEVEKVWRSFRPLGFTIERIKTEIYEM